MKRYVIGVTAAFLLLVLALGTADYLRAKDTRYDLEQQASTLHAGLIGSCDRVNVLRAQSNVSDLVSFRILSTSGQREASLAEATDGAENKLHAHSAKALFGEAANLTITAMTNCEAAVGSPKSYDTPVAGPIGDPVAGKLSPGVEEIVQDSREILRLEHADDR